MFKILMFLLRHNLINIIDIVTYLYLFINININKYIYTNKNVFAIKEQHIFISYMNIN